MFYHSPEFLAEKTAVHDAKHPARNILGTTDQAAAFWTNEVWACMPECDVNLTMPAKAAELVKCASNAFLLQKVLFANMVYDLSEKLGINYDNVKLGMGADPRIGKTHLNPIDASTEGKIGRGAGGHCFVKDFASFVSLYQSLCGGGQVLHEMEHMNLNLLIRSGKDEDIIRSVYGDKFIDILKK